jgi:hypothetical protein
MKQQAGALAAFLSGFCIPLAARAGLGDDLATLQKDQARLQARAYVASVPTHTVHEMALPTGVTVREFVSPAGRVFAVTWAGPWRPDLRVLLGAYFEQYVQARHNARASRGAVTVQLPGLVVQMAGHQRAFAGRAYAPDLVPYGVRIEEIR